MTHDESREDPGEPLSEADCELRTIFHGPLGEVSLLQGLLEGHGYRAFVDGESVKAFVRGGDVFAVALQVPRAEAAEAVALLEELRGQAVEEPALPSRAARLGRCLRWGFPLAVVMLPALLWYFPIGFVFALLAYAVAGIEYVRSARAEGEAPPSHRLTIASVVLGIACIGAWAVVWCCDQWYFS